MVQISVPVSIGSLVCTEASRVFHEYIEFVTIARLLQDVASLVISGCLQDKHIVGPVRSKA